MSDLEILANLKIAYLKLDDILENEDMQITLGEYNKLKKNMENLENVYRNLYKRIKKNNLYFRKDILISDEIYLDYMDKNNDYISYKDIKNEPKWWELYDFLVK